MTRCRQRFTEFFRIALVLAFFSGSFALHSAEKRNSLLSTEPVFAKLGGFYTNSFELSLNAPGQGVVRYTLDGSEPSESSTAYSKPIPITNSTVVRARTFDAGRVRSGTSSQTYIFVEAGLASFSSSLPLIVISSFGQKISRDQKTSSNVRVIEAGNERARFGPEAGFAGFADINVRGHTSLRYPKHSYHLDLKSEEHHSIKVPLLGLPKESDWILYAPYPDKTLMRDVLGYELSNAIGRYASRTRFVEVFVNETDGPLSYRHYVGVYVLEEKIKRDKNRVDIERLAPEDNKEPTVTGGYIFKKDHTDDFEGQGGFSLSGGLLTHTKPGFRSSQGNHFFYVEPKAKEITAPQRAWLSRYINSFERALYGEQFRDPKTGYAAYIEPDSFIDHHLLVELTKNIDGFRFSTFYYKDRGGKLNMGPIWDWNLSFGNANGREGWIPEGWYWSTLDDQQYSWFRRLFEDPDFAQHYVDRWGELRNDQFSPARICARIEELAQTLGEAQVRNFRRWRILGKNIQPNSYVGETFREEIDWMKNWLKSRWRWMDQQFLACPTFSLKPGAVPRGSRLELRAPVGKIFYTLDGSDPRTSGGGLSAKALAYTSAIPVRDATAVFCRARQGNRWSYPALAKYVGGNTIPGSGKQ